MWNDLTILEKEQYLQYCDKKYGKTFTFSETGEPLYFDSEFTLINTKMIYELLFSYYEN